MFDADTEGVMVVVVIGSERMSTRKQGLDVGSVRGDEIELERDLSTPASAGVSI